MERIEKLRWHRLRLTLACARTAPTMSAHPFSIVQALVKGASSRLGEEVNAREQAACFHLVGWRHSRRLKRGDELPLEVLVFNRGAGYAARWRDAFAAYLADPETGRNFDLARVGPVEERRFRDLREEAGGVPGEGEICLDFLSPLSFRPGKGHHRTCISKEDFTGAFTRRFARLFGGDFTYHPGRDDFSVLPFYWNYTEIRHPSRSQPGHTQFINGCTGKLYLKGRFANFLPFLILGSEVHAGPKTACAQGYYRLLPESAPFFDRFFPRPQGLLEAAAEALENHENARAELVAAEGFSFREDAWSEKLSGELARGEWWPAPARAFRVPKKGGSSRRLEILAFRDLVVQKYILKTVGGVLDRGFSECAIGFRRGRSRENAIEMIEEAVRNGCRFVAESDIADFFPSVDLEILKKRLDSVLPSPDTRLREALDRCLDIGCLVDGEPVSRERGLAQGSPLSPLLANLYLAGFDARVGGARRRLVRYADDFVVLTRTREEAVAALSEAESCLAGLGLRLNPEKTAVRQVRDGFEFLGLSFGRQDAGAATPESASRRLRKPLYVTEPYTFFALNGDALEIRRQRNLVETIPLRRISEIMVLEKACFSSSFLRKCVENGIPVTFTLKPGRHVATVKPDHRQYYEVAFRHGKKREALTETETCAIAREIAVAKLNNYLPLFRQRYRPGTNLILREIGQAAERAGQAVTVEQVRGVEGAAARAVYRHLNALIDDREFHLEKRERFRPDRINSLLNFCYHLLFTRLNAAVRATGLNPYLGFLHSPGDRYESLVYDLMEPFRARIDRLVLRLLNLGMIRAGDFRETDRGFRLSGDAVRKIINEFEVELTRGKSSLNLSLGESLHLQVMSARSWATGDRGLSFYEWRV